MIGALLAVLAACSGQDQAVDTSADANLCADGSTRLAGTGLCQSEAATLLPNDSNVRSPELQNCSWVVNETMLPGDEALLYRAAVCNGVTTTLAFAGGAQSAEISYETAALSGPEAHGLVVIRLFGTDPGPQGALTAAIAALPAQEAAGCEIRPAGREGWPADALLIAPTEAARRRLPQDEPIAACGEFGINENENSFWRVRQGYAAFYALGQEQPDFDAYNVQFVVRGEDGAWVAKP